MKSCAAISVSAALLGFAIALFVQCTSNASNGASACAPGDQDGVSGGTTALDLTVSDTAFAPIVLETENLAHVALTVKNVGTRPHDFVVACLPTPNDDGCPTTSCFPDASTIPPIAPDASVTVTFTTPNPEGIYTFESDVAGDTLAGQFVIQ